jgi:hypothetical protein
VDILATFSRDLLGRTRNKATLSEITREAFGADTGNPAAKEMFKAWSDTAEYLRLRFNAAGGRVGKLDDWGLPQAHDALKVGRVPYAEWRADIASALDPARMRDFETGLPLSPAKLEILLRDAYGAITSDGLARRAPMGRAFGVSVANRHAEHRFFKFKDGDAWMRYAQKYADPDAFNVMMRHIDIMARDIASIEILGPNPVATLTYAKQVAAHEAFKRDGLADGEAKQSVRTGVHRLEAIWRNYTGEANAPVNPKLAAIGGSVRAVITSAFLGKAFISSIFGDSYLSIMRTKMNGLGVTSYLGRLMGQLNPASAADRKRAVRYGLIAEQWSSAGAAQMRYLGETMSNEITQRMADFVLRVSFLSPWTQATRHAFGLEFLGNLGDRVGTPYADLPSWFRDALARNGVGEGRWARVQARHVGPDADGSLLDLNLLAQDEPEIADRLAEMIYIETERAVPSHNLASKSLLRHTQPGTVVGELARGAAMFKTFGLTMYFTHMRAIATQTTTMNKIGYAAAFFGGTTMAGALAVLSKDVVMGKDPRPATTPEFWGAAVAQGGGLGIWGDFLFAAENRAGRGVIETATGPIGSLVKDTGLLTLGNLVEAAGGDDTNAAREVVSYVRRYTPGGTIWYTQLALDRLLFDQLEKAVDPNYERRMRQRIRKLQRDYGNEFWWRPGEAAPDRAPDFGNAMEARP